jgi:voltage-gated potassium channel
MLVGIGFISTLTGTIASFLMAPAPEPEAKPKNEFLELAIRRLENFENLSSEEVREICAVLQGLKEKN